MKKKINVIPIKSKTLCKKCKYDFDNNNHCVMNCCVGCEHINSQNICRCFEIRYGEKCKYFKPFESELIK